MSGVLVIVDKLKGNAALTAQVPAARIMAGELPERTALPAISVTQISGVPITDLRGAVTMQADRVQVTVLAKTYTTLRTIMPLVLAACPHTRGTVNGIACDSIRPDIEGPDLSDDEVGFVSRSRDFVVRWAP